jgi:hypothetical protein
MCLSCVCVTNIWVQRCLKCVKRLNDEDESFESSTDSGSESELDVRGAAKPDSDGEDGIPLPLPLNLLSSGNFSRNLSAGWGRKRLANGQMISRVRLHVRLESLLPPVRSLTGHPLPKSRPRRRFQSHPFLCPNSLPIFSLFPSISGVLTFCGV